MRIVFMGTPEFALPSLRYLLEHRYDIVAVVTSPDRERGRGQKVIPSPVKRFALERNLPVMQPEKLSDLDLIHRITALQPDLMVVVAFRILPKELFAIPRQGAINLHASLLPKYRGAAPINWAIIDGEEETGVTTFFLKEKVDTGEILLQARVKIGPEETAGELSARLAEVGAALVVRTVRSIELGKALARPQDDALASAAPKIFKEDCRIDWNKPARQVHNFVRGLSPVPCAWMLHRGRTLRVYRTQIIPTGSVSGHVPGVVIDVQKERLIVATGDGAISLIEVQQEGRKRMGVAEFMRGYPIAVGERFS